TCLPREKSCCTIRSPFCCHLSGTFGQRGTVVSQGFQCNCIVWVGRHAQSQCACQTERVAIVPRSKMVVHLSAQCARFCFTRTRSDVNCTEGNDLARRRAPSELVMPRCWNKQ